MTKEEALAELQRIKAENGDEEHAHIEADRVLLQLIDDPVISEAYEIIPKWCA